MENKGYTLNRVRNYDGVIYVAKNSDELYSGEVIEENIKSDIFVIVHDVETDYLSQIMTYSDYEDEVHYYGRFNHPDFEEIQFDTFEEAREYENRYYEEKKKRNTRN